MNRIRILFIIGVIPILMSFRNGDETMNLYEQSFLLHFENIRIDTAYVIKCFDIELPQRIGKTDIVYIDDNAANFLKNKEPFYAIKIMPIRINKGNVEIDFIDYLLEENNGEVFMSNAGGEVFTFRYSDKEKKYKLIRRLKSKV